MARWKRYRLPAVLVILALAFLVWHTEGDPQEQVEGQFWSDRAQLEELAQRALDAGSSDGLAPPKDWQGISLYGQTVGFDHGGRGFGPSTSYWGVNYVPDDRPVGFQGTELAGCVPEGDGWLWREDGGDNWCYVERLALGWYYYEMHF